MTSTFPLARSGKPGYDPAEVDAFLDRAREAFAVTDGDAGLTSDDIRHTAFRVVRRKGYSARHVDAALERLEEAFAARERDRELAAKGSDAYYAETRALAQEILDRLARPEGKKFRRVSLLARGYHPADVDAFAERITAFIQEGRALPVETVRTIAFRARYRGYSETQVDLLLDAVVRVILAVR